MCGTTTFAQIRDYYIAALPCLLWRIEVWHRTFRILEGQGQSRFVLPLNRKLKQEEDLEGVRPYLVLPGRLWWYIKQHQYKYWTINIYSTLSKLFLFLVVAGFVKVNPTDFGRQNRAKSNVFARRWHTWWYFNIHPLPTLSETIFTCMLTQITRQRVSAFRCVDVLRMNSWSSNEHHHEEEGEFRRLWMRQTQMLVPDGLKCFTVCNKALLIYWEFHHMTTMDTQQSQEKQTASEQQLYGSKCPVDVGGR